MTLAPVATGRPNLESSLMDSHRADSPKASEIDLNALAWVHEELRRSLESAHKALRRFVKDHAAALDADAEGVDAAVLRAARQQIHQGVGALELVGLPGAARVLRASEAVVQRVVSKPKRLNAQVIETIERASFALLDYVGRLLSGKTVSELSMFPQFRAVQELAGAERVHPSDLWNLDWAWLESPQDPSASPLTADGDTRRRLETLLLGLMRSVEGGRQRAVFDAIGKLCAGLGAGAAQPRMATLWKLAAAMFEAQANGLLKHDLYSKRVASRLLPQFRLLENGQDEVSERLARDLLFFCSQAAAPGPSLSAPRMAAVRRACALPDRPPVDYNEVVLGRFDPAMLVQARKRVASAKDFWGEVAGGEVHRLAGLTEQFALVGDSLRLLYPGGKRLANELEAAATRVQQSDAAPPAALAMEVATSLLYLDASLEDADFDEPTQRERVKRLADRVASVRDGGLASPLETWMEELYRRVSERQTVGSVVHELRATLSESEKLIDAYFRNPADPSVLVPVPNQITSMRGVLSVLGLDQASQAALHMRSDVDALLSSEVDPAQVAQAGTFDRLAGNLGALGFLIDMFSVQPQMAKSLFTFDARTGTLSPLMGRPQPHISFGEAPPVAPSLIAQAQSLAQSSTRSDVPAAQLARELAMLSLEAQAADQPGLAVAVSAAQAAIELAPDDKTVKAAREQLAGALNDFVNTSSKPMELGPPEFRLTPRPTEPVVSDLDQDVEMRQVFLEEAREVLAGAYLAMDALAQDPFNLEYLTAVRRAFHTLKGSSRMVGLSEFGATAWACEQVYNARLAEQRPADPPLLDFSADALAELAQWIDAMAQGQAVDAGLGPRVQAAADALMALEHDAFGSNTLPSARTPLSPLTPGADEFTFVDVGVAPAPLSREPLFTLPPDLPSAADLDLPDAGSETTGAEPAMDDDAVELSFDFELQRPRDWAAEPGQAEPAPVDDLALDLSPLTEDHAPVDQAEFADTELPDLLPAAEATEVGDTGDFGQGGLFAEEDQTKRIGDLSIGIALFNVYLNEADELSRRLRTELAEWAMELHRPVGEAATALAHSLAGSSATVGFADLSQLARALEHALLRSNARGHASAEEAQLYVEVADDVRRLLHQFAAGFLKTPQPGLLERLAEFEVDADLRRQSRGADGAQPPLAPPPGAKADEHAAPEARADDRQEDFGDFGVTGFRALTDLPERVFAPVQRAPLATGDEDIDVIDAVDTDLFPIFEEEGQELLPLLAARLRDWARHPADHAAPAAAMRALHTLKGGARLAGAMRLGELCHRLESRIEQLLSHGPAHASDVETLQLRGDALTEVFESLRAQDARTYAEAAAAAERVAAELPEPQALTELDLMPSPAPIEPHGAQPSTPVPAAVEPSSSALEKPQSVQPAPCAPAVDVAPAADAPDIDWSRFQGTAQRRAVDHVDTRTAQSAVRVRAPLLDRMVNQAGEVSITRNRIEAEVGLIGASLVDLNENLERMRVQLRELELQGETQMSSRIEAAKAAAQTFDPLEFDRFTRFQELTRMMAESVNDVATVQRTLRRAVDSTEDELAAQTRLTRSLQDDLLRTRLVEFESQVDRLYRVVRQAAKETGKQVRLDIVGGSIELDRGVLDRMTASFEHVLRNCVTHGIESAQERVAAGKDAVGSIIVALQHERNEVAVEFRDDGRGLDLLGIRDKGVAMELIDGNASHSDAELADLIFHPGFSTAVTVTELAGRGVGLDVVRADVSAMGGRIETATAFGKGTSFKLVLPLTTAVTQVVMLRCGDVTVAVPSSLVETVQRATPLQVDAAYASGVYTLGERSLPFFWLGALLQHSARGIEGGRARAVIVIRSVQMRIALHVDEVLGNQEAIVKNLGPQLSRLPGLAGMTLLTSGAVALIYNPVALATTYGDAARALMRAAQRAPTLPMAVEPVVGAAPLVLVVDDSLTVRRVTQRLLVREGYRVTLAKDGIEALERLAEETPQVVLSDIEMPRMDGFDLVRNIRGDVRLASLPVIMITSRIAQKHRDVAVELGVEHYLGKPYAEEDLLALIGRYALASVRA